MGLKVSLKHVGVFCLFILPIALGSVPYVQGEVLGLWTGTTAYPVNVGGQSCVVDSGYIYCVGGDTGNGATDAVYSASVSEGVVGTWTSQNVYPTSISGESCVVYSGYIYCVGGYQTNGATDAVYSASVSGGVVGMWSSATTTPYLTNIYDQSCVVYSGYIYCVGGDTGNSATAAVYSAPLLTGTVGGWTPEAAYPAIIESESCATYSGYIYCVAGGRNGGFSPAVYSALVVFGIEYWTYNNWYAVVLDGESCAIYSGYIYCIGGSTPNGATDAVYYASVGSGGVGTWTSQNVYPTSISGESCVVYSGYIYCVGGDTGNGATDAVYSAQILAETSTTLTSAVSSTTFTTSSAFTTFSSQTPVSSTTTTISASPSITSTVLTTTTTTGSLAGTTTTTFTSPLGTSYSTTSSVASSTTRSVTQTGTTTTGIIQSETTTSTSTTLSSTTSAGTVTVTETDTFNVLLTQIYHELEQFEAFILQTLGFRVTATPVGQQVNRIIVTTMGPVQMTVSYSVVGGGSPTPPIFHYVLKGVSKALTLSKVPTVVTTDAGTTWSVTPNPLIGSTTSQRWYSTQALTGSASAATIVFTFAHEYYLTMNVSGPGTVTPSSGWYNAGFKVVITATPTSGHKFTKWTGSGTGSYTGTKNPVTITTNSGITETATFT